MSTVTVIDNLREINLKEELLRGIDKYGIKKLTVDQERAIKLCINGHYVIAQAHTLKAATISISILKIIDTSLNECQALILVPTVKLALYIQKMIADMSCFMKVYCHACIGGRNMRCDMSKLDTKPHVVVGTPRLVYDMISRKSLRTQFIKIMAVHKADEMSQGFKDQTEEVFEFLEKDIQVIMLSATMPEDVLDMSRHFMGNKRVRIRVLSENNSSLEGQVPD